MKMQESPPTKRDGAGFKRPDWLGTDLLVGLLAAIAVSVGTVLRPDTLVGARSFSVAILGVSVGLAAIVFGALAVLVAFLSEEYLAVLERVEGGLEGVWRPYAVVIWVCVLAAVLSVATFVAWPAVVPEAQGILLGLTLGSFVWGLVGAGQLVEITRFHGIMRLRLLRSIQGTRNLAAERAKNSKTG